MNRESSEAFDAMLRRFDRSDVHIWAIASEADKEKPLDDDELVRFSAEIAAFGMQAVVEVHDREEMERAIDAGAMFIGVNNRNLKTFVTTLETTFDLAAMAPANCTLVSESGIKTAGDVVRHKTAGAHSILVGESLLREASPGAAARHLMALI